MDVDTMVWSSDARNMPSIRPTITVTIWRCVRFSPAARAAGAVDMGTPRKERDHALIVAFSNYPRCSPIPPYG
ncbi:hypothetical protein D3C85_1831970 [compost metagenome]